MNSAGVHTTPLARALAVSATMRSAPVPARIAPSVRAGSRPARTIAADRSAGSWWRADSSSRVMAQKRPWGSGRLGGQREDRGLRVGDRVGEVAPSDRHGDRIAGADAGQHAPDEA